MSSSIHGQDDATVAAHDNPFRPPVAAIEDVDAQRPRALVYAGRGRRFLTFVVDYVCYLLVAFLIGVFMTLAFGPHSMAFLDTTGGNLLFSLGLFFGYYLAFEASTGRTPGKYVTGTVVVDARGGRPRFTQVLGRTAARMIPFEAFTFFGEVGVHDRLPGTRVVMAR